MNKRCGNSCYPLDSNDKTPVIEYPFYVSLSPLEDSIRHTDSLAGMVFRQIRSKIFQTFVLGRCDNPEDFHLLVRNCSRLERRPVTIYAEFLTELFADFTDPFR